MAGKAVGRCSAGRGRVRQGYRQGNWHGFAMRDLLRQGKRHCEAGSGKIRFGRAAAWWCKARSGMARKSAW
jgi:hypothetical protein